MSSVTVLRNRLIAENRRIKRLKGHEVGVQAWFNRAEIRRREKGAKRLLQMRKIREAEVRVPAIPPRPKIIHKTGGKVGHVAREVAFFESGAKSHGEEEEGVVYDLEQVKKNTVAALNRYNRSFGPWYAAQQRLAKQQKLFPIKRLSKKTPGISRAKLGGKLYDTSAWDEDEEEEGEEEEEEEDSEEDSD